MRRIKYKMFQAIYKETRSGLYQTCDMILLCNVVDLDTGEEFRDHCWVKSSKLFSKLDLNINDTITFDAIVHMYPSSNGLKLGLQKIKKIEKVKKVIDMKKKISFKTDNKSSPPENCWLTAIVESKTIIKIATMSWTISEPRTIPANF